MPVWRQPAAGLAAIVLLAMLAVLAFRPAAAAGSPAAAEDAADARLVAAGSAIYLTGTLPSGALLHGTRKEGGQDLAGEAAACVRCHRRSGLGAQEGRYSIPPVAAPYLFQAANARSGDEGLPFAPGQRLDRPGYDERSLSRALRDGIDSSGKPLDYLMPRFKLGDEDIRALVAYLRRLSPQQVPWATATDLHFATIITPDADPTRRQGVLDVLQAYFAEKNTFPFPPSPQMHVSAKGGPAKAMYMANRHWQLHVWQLEGPSSTWQAQLERFLANQPVMAVISGLAGDDWSPVHAFCEQARLPCLFPNAEVPVVANQDFYSLYFSKGVLLEAQLIAHQLGAPAAGAAAAPVVQVHRAGDSGDAAAAAFASAWQEAGGRVRDIVIPASAGGSEVRQAVASALTGQAGLVLWLRPGDLQALGDLPAPAGPAFVSGLMGGLDQAPLPAQWRPGTWVSYPVDLPQHRHVRLEYPLSWFRIRGIPVVSEQVQADTWLACGLLSETLNHMSDNFGREFLVERLEELLVHRILTGYYPRLSMAEGQRFASKGGYLVHLPAQAGGEPSPEGGWTVP